MSKLILMIVLGLSSCAANAATSSVQFLSGSMSFTVLKSPSRIEFRDEIGDRGLAIRPCNKKLVDDFWKQVLAEAQTAQPAIQDPTREASVKIDGVRSTLYGFQHATASLSQLPARAFALSFESTRRCKK